MDATLSGSATLELAETGLTWVEVFYFDAAPTVGGATGTVRVTNGKFDVTY
jgi:uncharacterized protein with NAD-binding domain and iron-sulfur cluster